MSVISYGNVTVTNINDGINGTDGQMLYATCITAAAIAAKVATLASGMLTLTAGATVAVKFAYANTAANPTLNISSTGAIAIYAGGTSLAGAYNWEAGDTVVFVYDGTYWQITNQNSIDNLEIGGKNLLTGTNSTTELTATGYWADHTWRAAGSGTGTTTAVSITDCPDKSITTGWRFDVMSVAGVSYDKARSIGQNRVPIIAGREYTLSCYAKGAGQLYMFYGVSSYAPVDSSGKIDITSEWKRYSVTFTAESTTAYVADTGANVFFGILGTDVTGYICGMKLESGNKVTDWSPAPEDAVDTTIEYIVGTQTDATGNWTGKTREMTLRVGKMIMYQLPYAGSGNASLKLTLADGTLTANIPVYMTYSTGSNTGAKTRVTTHWPAGSVIELVYNGTEWYSTNYNTNVNSVDRVQYGVSLAASVAMAVGSIAVMGNDGKLKLLDATAFDINCPPLYVGTAYSATDVTNSTTRNNNYMAWGKAFAFTDTHSIAGAVAGKTVYIVGNLEGNLFTPTSNVLTCTVPDNNDGLYYIRLGRLSTAANGVLEMEHPIFAYINDSFQRIDKGAAAIATATKQYFWHDPNGAHISTVEGDGNSGYNSLWNSNGLMFRNNTNNLAAFTTSEIQFYDGTGNADSNIVARFGSDGVTLGQDSKNRAYLTDRAFKLIDNQDKTYLYVSDLRNSDGIANIESNFTGDGSTVTFTLAVPASSVDYSVYVNNTIVTSGIYKTTNYIVFDTAPSENSKIRVEYVTHSYLAKGYTIGIRYNNSGIGIMSFAANYDTIASGYCSFAEGYHTTASDRSSHAEGYMTIASGYSSHAEGINTTASGDSSHAEGYHTTASENFSHAEGGNTTASGQYSHAEGSNTTASSKYSHASGRGTIANGTAQTVIGKFNIEASNYAFIIGNGTGNAVNLRSNAFAVGWDGNVVSTGGGTFGGSISGTTGTFTGAVTGASYSGGAISGTTGTFTDAISGASLSTTGSISGGAISGTTGTFTGAVTGASYSGGAISGTTGTFTGNVTHSANILPNQTNTRYLGTSDYRWQNLYSHYVNASATVTAGAVASYTPSWKTDQDPVRYHCVVSAGICSFFFMGNGVAHSQGTVICTLPSGARPSSQVNAPFVKMSGNVVGVLTITTAGEVSVGFISSTTSTGRIYFNCTYPVV